MVYSVNIYLHLKMFIALLFGVVFCVNQVKVVGDTIHIVRIHLHWFLV